MKLIYFFILFTLSIIYSLCYEEIVLKYSSSYFYIPLRLSPDLDETDYVFSTMLPINLYPSLKCEKCIEYRINESKYEIVKENTSVPYYYYNFTGDIYKIENTTLNKMKFEQNFLAFDNITYVVNYTGKGRFSLSYLNFNFNVSESEKIFALKFTDSGALLHLKGINNKLVTNKKKTFNVTTYLDDYDDYANKSMWYMEFPSLYLKDKMINATENYKLTLDISTDKFHIPNKFFIENIKNIFPEDAKCQILKAGYFSCQCSEDYKEKFPNFKFKDEKGETFFVNVTDYILYESSISGSYCYVHIVINYDNDLFIGGISVLNNYYSIFNISDKSFSIYDNDNSDERATTTFVVMFFIVLLLGFVLFFGGYFCYNKYVINDPNNNIPVGGNGENLAPNQQQMQAHAENQDNFEPEPEEQ